MTKYRKISVIGTGVLARHLSKGMEDAGISVSEVYGRDKSRAKSLSSILYNAKATDSLDFAESSASVFFICVKDEAIMEIAHKISLPENALVVHCSGATSAEILAKQGRAFGVFYPVQTFSPSAKNLFKNIPVCIEASHEEWETVLETMAKKMESFPYFMNSHQRLALHLAAVFACNFTNHLYTISQEVLKENNLPFRLLQSLITETVNKALMKGPEVSQTGPALREDHITMNRHLELLSQFPRWKEIYNVISGDIVTHHNT